MTNRYQELDEEEKLLFLARLSDSLVFNTDLKFESQIDQDFLQIYSDLISKNYLLFNATGSSSVGAFSIDKFSKDSKLETEVMNELYDKTILFRKQYQWDILFNDDVENTFILKEFLGNDDKNYIYY